MVKTFLEWGQKNAAEMAGDARIIIIDGTAQSSFASKLQVSTTSLVLLKRYGNQVVQLKRINWEGGDTSDLSSIVWKAVFDFDNAETVYRMPKLVDETLNYSYYEQIYRSFSKQYQRLRHLEEEELLIYIAMPLSIMMLTATFFLKHDR